jgi:hypothetical protein
VVQAMARRFGQRCRGALKGRWCGVALTEVVIAVVVLALIAASVPPVLVLLARFQYSWNEQRVAESLTRNHLEYVKVVPYVAGNSTNPSPDYMGGNATEQMPPVPNDNWEVIVVATPIVLNPDGTSHPVDFGLGEQDTGLQEISVQVEHVDRVILEGVAYKVDRQQVWRGQ